MKVYKYRANLSVNNKKRDTDCLVNNLFYASEMRQLNDPFEGSIALPTSLQDESWTLPIKRDLYEVGIYSLTKLGSNDSFPANELLWAHYADSHKGFCIEYDLDSLIDKGAKEYDLRNVIHVAYSHERPSIDKYTIQSSLEVQKRVFGTKSLAWKYENEVRLVFQTAGLKQLPRKAVTAIYFGLRISLEDRKEIIQKLSSRNIDFYQMERVDNLYRLKATKLEMDYKYEVVGEKHLATVDNYTIFYKSLNKDANSLRDFIQYFRRSLQRPSNITVIDDMRAKQVLDDYKPRMAMSAEEIDILSNHWIAYSSFDAPTLIWIYPEK